MNKPDLKQGQLLDVFVTAWDTKINVIAYSPVQESDTKDYNWFVMVSMFGQIYNAYWLTQRNEFVIFNEIEKITKWEPQKEDTSILWNKTKERLEETFDIEAIAIECFCGFDIGVEFNYPEKGILKSGTVIDLRGVMDEHNEEEAQNIMDYLEEKYDIPFDDTDYQNMDVPDIYPIESFADLQTKVLKLRER